MADPHSVVRKLPDEAALLYARVPCPLQCAALGATARLSQKQMLTGIAAPMATSPLATLRV